MTELIVRGKRPQFAKLFDTEELGQVLVKLDTDPENESYEVRFFWHPGYGTGLGVCSIAISVNGDEEEHYQTARAIFERLEQKDVVKLVASTDHDLVQMVSGPKSE